MRARLGQFRINNALLAFFRSAHAVLARRMATRSTVPPALTRSAPICDVFLFLFCFSFIVGAREKRRQGLSRERGDAAAAPVAPAVEEGSADAEAPLQNGGRRPERHHQTQLRPFVVPLFYCYFTALYSIVSSCGTRTSS